MNPRRRILRCEIQGLQLGYVRQNVIRIKRRVYRRKQGEEGKLKSRKGERDVRLAPGTAALLKEYRRLLFDTQGGTWLFPSENAAKPLDYRNVFTRRIKPALAKSGLANINFQGEATNIRQSEQGVDGRKNELRYYGAYRRRARKRVYADTV